MRHRSTRPLARLLGLAACCCALLAALTPRPVALAAAPIAFPSDFMPNVKTDYGAKGDGVTDDTNALKAALADERADPNTDYYGRPKALFLPAGTYLVRDTLEWIGCCVTLQGQGAGNTIIKLANNAPGFGDPNAPKPVILTPDGNMSFRQNIWDLTIDTGSGNPGAVGADYIANNSGAIRGVEIRSGDGAGVYGLNLSRQWPGPCLFKDLRISGFDYGIFAGNAEYGPTFEQITLSGQRKAGIRNEGNTLAIRKLQSANSVPAIESPTNYGSLIVLDSTFSGGASGASAIDSGGYLYARNISAGGYQSAVKSKGLVVPGATQSEYVSDKIYSLFDSPPRSLGLPIEETPSYYDTDVSKWGKFTFDYYGDTSQLQALLNSGKSTIYFPFGGYFSYDERAVTVPATVKRIVGFSSIVNGDGNGTNGGGIKFVVAENSSEPLIIEQFGYGVKIEQRSARPLAIKHGNYQYTSTAGAGKLYLEDVEMGNFRMQASQQVWARQFNDESDGPKIVNNGGSLWILGLKTERAGTVIDTEAGGKTELLGTLIYPATQFTAAQKQQAAFVSRDSSMSLIYSTSVYCNGCGYDIQVQETRGGTTRKLLSSGFPGRMPLFTGYTAATPASCAASGPAPAQPGDQSVFLPIVLHGGGATACVR